MHKLQRTEEPQELVQARVDETPDWDHFPGKAKKKVRDELLLMQDFRCAYCERKLHDVSSDEEDQWDGHIEHFRKKSPLFFPELTFAWENLFYSCSTGSTCGRHKDHYIDQPERKDLFDLLIDPCKDNPEDFLAFDDRGRIFARSGLSEENKKRADFTIKAFHLDDPALTQKRKECQKRYEWMKKVSIEDIGPYLTSINNEPFLTAIYHYFGKRVVS